MPIKTMVLLQNAADLLCDNYIPGEHDTRTESGKRYDRAIVELTTQTLGLETDRWRHQVETTLRTLKEVTKDA